jgi:cytochrome oxidase Cu insertion factor (SCO1/SenC/PrrC family)
LAVGVGAGAGIAILHRAPAAQDATLAEAPSPPVVTWAPGARPAPNFTLADQSGKAFTLGGLRGRTVLVTFLDPLCRNFCPLEARVLSDAVRQLPPAARPAVVSVSVNPWGDSRASLRADAVRWDLGGSWRWGVGSASVLAHVWHNYEIAVQVTKKVIAGQAVREITHTAAVYLVDGRGNERALLLYPFKTSDVLQALAAMSKA